MLDIIQIVLQSLPQFLDAVRGAAQRVDLGPAGDTRNDAVPGEVPLEDLAARPAGHPHADRVGTRPDERHLTLEDVEQLRQLIEARAPEERPEPGHARIALERLPAPRGIACRMVHRAELVELEDSALMTVPLLPEQHRTVGLQLDEAGDRRQQRQGREHRERRNSLLEPAAQRLESRPRRRSHEAPQHRFLVAVGASVGRLRSAVHDADVDRQPPELGPEAAGVLRPDEDQLVEPGTPAKVEEILGVSVGPVFGLAFRGPRPVVEDAKESDGSAHPVADRREQGVRVAATTMDRHPPGARARRHAARRGHPQGLIAARPGRSARAIRAQREVSLHPTKR